MLKYAEVTQSEGCGYLSGRCFNYDSPIHFSTQI